MMQAVREALRIELPDPVTINIPAVYYYDGKHKVLVMQDAGAGVKDLRASLLAGEINSKKADVIGCVIAKFASKIHAWSKTQPQLCEDIRKHRQATTVALWAAYGRLAITIGMVSGGALEEYREAFEQTQLVMTKEMQDSANCGIIHGDYWTRNILVSLDATNKELGLEPYVIDWEVSKVAPPLFDIGKISAEIYAVNHFRQIPEAISLLHSFLSSYDGLDSVSSDARWQSTLVQVWWCGLSVYQSGAPPRSWRHVQNSAQSLFERVCMVCGMAEAECSGATFQKGAHLNTMIHPPDRIRHVSSCCSRI